MNKTRTCSICLCTGGSFYYLNTHRKDLDSIQSGVLNYAGLIYGARLALRFWFLQPNRPIG